MAGAVLQHLQRLQKLLKQGVIGSVALVESKGTEIAVIVLVGDLGGCLGGVVDWMTSIKGQALRYGAHRLQRGLEHVRNLHYF